MPPTKKDEPFSREKIKFPISYAHIKERFREGIVHDEERQFWWPMVIKLLHNGHIEGVPTDFVENAKLRLETAADLSMDKIASGGGFKYLTLDDAYFAFTRLFEVQEPELMRPICHMIAAEFSEDKDGIAIAFAMWGDVFNTAAKFSAFTAVAHRAKLYTFRKLLVDNMPQTYCALERINALTENYLNLLFDDFFVALVPKACVLHIVDCFLLEGFKIVWRFALGFFHVYKHELKSGQFGKAEDFWNYAKAQKSTVDFALIQRHAFEQDVSVLDKAIRTNRFVMTRSKLERLMEEGKIELAGRARESLHLKGIDPVVANVDSMVRFSDILARDEAAMLVEAIPASVRAGHFELKYASYRDGWSLDTLYNNCSTFFPCLILIRALNCEATIGAYVSTPIGPPSKTTKGDGSSFVFRLNGPRKKIYPWSLAGFNLSKTQQDNVALNQFAVCSSEFLLFGSDEHSGSNALYVYEDLRSCTSGRSDTYGNPPLAPEAKGGMIQIKDMEVLCGPGRMTFTQR